jgi:hypothetical protein
MDPITVAARSAIEEELATLDGLSLQALRARHQEITGTPLPKFMRRGLMVLAVSHAVQEEAFGGLERRSQKQLDELVAGIVPDGEKPPAPRNRKIRSGTRLLREWQGRVHEVLATGDGFTWNGERYRSLSVIAREITGTRWNGWVFFGVKKKKAKVPVQQAAASPRIPKRKLTPRTGAASHALLEEAAHG